LETAEGCQQIIEQLQPTLKTGSEELKSLFNLVVTLWCVHQRIEVRDTKEAIDKLEEVQSKSKQKTQYATLMPTALYEYHSGIYSSIFL
ncbi:hypothetical protein ACXWOC_10200, partial [Streptococcus pyogenes]